MQRLSLPPTPHAHLIPSPREMAEIDKVTIASGISGLELMERAGKGVALATIQRLQQLNFRKICIVCGPGNNGGDGFVVARVLKEQGFEPHVVLAGASRYSADLTVQIERWQKIGMYYLFPEHSTAPTGDPQMINEAELNKLLGESEVLIDALFGTGQAEAPRGAIAHIIRELSGKGLLIVALDIPSGVNADSGQVFDPAVRAQQTFCIELMKRGMLQYPARDYCGDITVIPIGLRPELRGTPESMSEFSLITDKHASLPRRAPDAHKGSLGHVLVIGGSPSMPGAPALSALAALRTGSGLVSKVHRDSQYCNSAPEILLRLLEDGYSLESGRALLPELAKYDSFVVGPGMGTGAGTEEFIALLLSHLIELGRPFVLDADGLNIFAKLRKSMKYELQYGVLTPHPGEMGRLLDISTAEVQADRYTAAKKLAAETCATVVLKGAASIVYGSGTGRVNTTGNPFMATAGSGDVLSGMIASLLGQGLHPLEAASLGVFFHGRAGDIARQQLKGPIIASDIIAAIPHALSPFITL